MAAKGRLSKAEIFYILNNPGSPEQIAADLNRTLAVVNKTLEGKVPSGDSSLLERLAALEKQLTEQPVKEEDKPKTMPPSEILKNIRESMSNKKGSIVMTEGMSEIGDVKEAKAIPIHQMSHYQNTMYNPKKP
jgi:hypothetical protein